MRRALSYLCALITIVAGLTVVAGPAEAGSPAATDLCQGFASCAKKGWSNHGYAKVRSRSHWGARPGTNCTNYAAYMLTSRGRLTALPEGTGNAGTWGAAAAAAGHPVSRRPRVGDIAYWKPRKSRNIGTRGHVAYVERVRRDGSIVISHDNWNNTFVVTRLKRRSSTWPTGFIRYRRSDGSPTGRLTSVGVAEGRLQVTGFLTDPDVTSGRTSARIAVAWGRTTATTIAAAQQELGTLGHTTFTPPLPYRFRWNMTPPRSGEQSVTIYAVNTGRGADRRLGTYTVVMP